MTLVWHGRYMTLPEQPEHGSFVTSYLSFSFFVLIMRATEFRRAFEDFTGAAGLWTMYRHGGTLVFGGTHTYKHYRRTYTHRDRGIIEAWGLSRYGDTGLDHGVGVELGTLYCAFLPDYRRYVIYSANIIYIPIYTYLCVRDIDIYALMHGSKWTITSVVSGGGLKALREMPQRVTRPIGATSDANAPGRPVFLLGSLVIIAVNTALGLPRAPLQLDLTRLEAQPPFLSPSDLVSGGASASASEKSRTEQ